MSMSAWWAEFVNRPQDWEGWAFFAYWLLFLALLPILSILWTWFAVAQWAAMEEIKKNTAGLSKSLDEIKRALEDRGRRNEHD
jgi:hypothetical protein